MKNSIIILLIGVLFSGLAMGQETPDPRIEQAQQLEVEKKFKEAFKLYEKIHKTAPEDNALTFKLAGMAHTSKNYKKAIKYYEKLAPNGNPTVLYNLACSYAMRGKEKKALEALESAVDKGFIQLGLMKTDPDLSSIRDSEKFEMIASSVKSIENEPEAQKFDFWVGEWNVYGLNDAKVGESTIQKILNGNVILENWNGAGGFTGKSFNHYHMDSGRWIQYWVDQSSGRIYFEGNFDPEQNAMVYYEQVDKDSEKPLRRLTFFDISPDSVRQYSQLSSDYGKNWNVEYDFMYVRKP
ncbi:MAG: tetratricopeptide repeat protein [FCB group bacterium]|nr:tetratricopeptide repeat protein [FCB group bacterium]MBL7028850.1 tetratricopeptide repeat protein [Candidatus Neomarinimicrobiota bacterium]MBL7121695.1 tetratricopeptide repeat protein [Candidatus Neomarinimicrobiota bacterium]